jgi:hypothetical protein
MTTTDPILHIAGVPTRAMNQLGSLFAFTSSLTFGMNCSEGSMKDVRATQEASFPCARTITHVSRYLDTACIRPAYCFTGRVMMGEEMRTGRLRSGSFAEAAAGR